jgi:hypothetical protein
MKNKLAGRTGTSETASESIEPSADRPAARLFISALKVRGETRDVVIDTVGAARHVMSHSTLPGYTLRRVLGALELPHQLIGDWGMIVRRPDEALHAKRLGRLRDYIPYITLDARLKPEAPTRSGDADDAEAWVETTLQHLATETLPQIRTAAESVAVTEALVSPFVWRTANYAPDYDLIEFGDPGKQLTPEETHIRNTVLSNYPGLDINFSS